MTERKPHPHLTPEARSAMLADYIAGVKLEAIAALYGVHISYPGHYARKRGHPPRQKQRCDADITPAQRASVLADYAAGDIIKTIAHRHGISPNLCLAMAHAAGLWRRPQYKPRNTHVAQEAAP